MRMMFHGARTFDGDLSKWDVRNVTDMEEMFSYANSFTGKGLGNWDVGRVECMDGMFRYTKIKGDGKANDDLS